MTTREQLIAWQARWAEVNEAADDQGHQGVGQRVIDSWAGATTFAMRCGTAGLADSRSPQFAVRSPAEG